MILEQILSVYLIVASMLFWFSDHDGTAESLGAILIWPIYFPARAIIGLFRKAKP